MDLIEIIITSTTVGKNPLEEMEYSQPKSLKCCAWDAWARGFQAAPWQAQAAPTGWEGAEPT